MGEFTQNVCISKVMTNAAVPSTLVKCLYLFFDLPEIPEDEADVQDSTRKFTLRERRILLQKTFVQVCIPRYIILPLIILMF